MTTKDIVHVEPYQGFVNQPVDLLTLRNGSQILRVHTTRAFKKDTQKMHVQINHFYMNVENATLLKRWKFDFYYNAVAVNVDTGKLKMVVRMDKIISPPPAGYYVRASDPLFEDEPYIALNLIEEFFETVPLGREKSEYNQNIQDFINFEHENLFQWREVYYGSED